MTLRKPSRSLALLAVLGGIAISSVTGRSWGEVEPDATRDFLAKLREPVVLLNLVAPQMPLPDMTEEERLDVLAAKSVLIDFLVSFRTFQPDPMTFLSVELRDDYRSSQELYAKNFDAESLLAIEVYALSIDRKSPLQVSLYTRLTDTTEGVDRIRQISFGIKREADRWTIARIGGRVPASPGSQ